ncbi:hypothetical protein ACOMHN_041448 [Nucella lapillus]
MLNGTTQEFPVQHFVQYNISQALWTAVPPVVLLLGTFGNVMTVLVMRALTHRRANQLGDPSMGVYFPCLAVSDQIVLTVGLGRKWVSNVFLYDIRILHVVVCKLHKFVVYAGGRISSWILVAVTSQRVMTVMWPLRQRMTSTRKRAMAVVGTIVSTSCMLDVGILFLYSHLQTDTSHAKCQPVRDSPEAAYYEDEVYPWLSIVSGSLLPLTVLGLNNLILACKVRQSLRASRQLTQTDPKQARAKKSSSSSSLSLTLIVTSLAFMLLTSPIPAGFVIKSHLPRWWWNGRLEADVYLADTVLDLLWYCNSAVNFYLYFLTGPTFRRQAGRLLCVWSGGKPQRDTQSSSTVMAGRYSR